MPDTTTMTSLPQTTGSDAMGDIIVTTMKTVMEKPYAEYTEVKVAVMIDRVYIPLVVTVGLAGNVLCFLTLVFSSLRSTSTCVYMAAIAVLDCLILVLDLCVLIRGYLGHTKFYLSSDWACGFHNFLFYFAIHFDVLLLLAMTIDRYIVVKFPLKAQRLCTPRSALKAITGVGLFTFALNFHIFFTRRLGDSGKCWYPDPDVDYFMKKIYTWIDASIYSFIPFLALLVLNVLIIRQIRTSQKFSKQFTERRGGHRTSSVKMDSEGDTVVSEMETSSTNLASCDEVNGNAISCDKTPCGNVSNKKTLSSKVSNKPNGMSNSTSISTISGKGRRSVSGSVKRKAATNTNITVMLLLVSFTFLVLTSPVVIVLLVKRYYWLPDTPAESAQARLAHAVVDNLMYTNHAVNFLLYCISGTRFRLELKRLLAAICCRR